MARSFVVSKGVCRVIAAAAYVATDQTDPKVLCGAAHAAFVVWRVAVGAAMGGKGIILCVAADWAA